VAEQPRARLSGPAHGPRWLEEGAGVTPLRVQPAAAREQVATRGDLLWQNRRSSTLKENATQCKTSHYVNYTDSNRVLVSIILLS